MHDDRSGTEFVAAQVRTPTLTLLRELLHTADQVGPAVSRRAGLSSSELAALELLVERRVGPAELARELGVTSAAASGIVDRLEQRGHVLRVAHPTDRRRTDLAITPEGHEEVIGHLMPMFAALAALDASLDPAERRAVDRFLRGSIEAVRRLL